MNRPKHYLYAILAVVALFFFAPSAHAQNTLANCISLVSNSNHVMVLKNSCSQIALVQVYDSSNTGITDGQLYQGQELSFVSYAGVRYKWFACPANTMAVYSGTKTPADFNTNSYACIDPN